VSDLDAAAQKAKLTGQIRSFLDWLGDGRKLTQTGRIGLADARYLVEFLRTGDVIDPAIGGRTFKTKSSEELASLTRVVEWAKATRLVRATGTRIVPVKKNAALADRPLDLVLAMLTSFPRLGKSLFPTRTYRQSIVGDEFGDVSEAILTALLTSAGPRALASLSDMAYTMIAAQYELGRLTELQHDFLRQTIAVDIEIAMSALHVLGVVVVDPGTDRERPDASAELTDLGRYAIRRLRHLAEPGDPLLQVRITLEDVADPAVWRRVLIPAAYSLDRVHTVIQAAMGWQDSHLHAFRIGDRTYAAAHPDDDMAHLDETQFRLGDVVAGTDRIDYEYDFGDGWDHALFIEARAVAQDGAVYPACVAGEGACPPEDCGGGPGFAEFKETLAGPPSAARDALVRWAGGEYDPDRFDLSAVNTAVAAAG
jgi:hypothetical protein